MAWRGRPGEFPPRGWETQGGKKWGRNFRAVVGVQIKKHTELTQGGKPPVPTQGKGATTTGMLFCDKGKSGV